MNSDSEAKFKKTTLVWDKYMDYLIEAIDESNFMKRSEIKPMATPKDNLESHLTSRAIHQRNAANIARRIARGLGLNEQYVYVGMLMHDAGHPFSAHEGEEMFTSIGEIYNVQYFHHNAKGVEVIQSENLCEKAISKIPNIRKQPELRRVLEEEFPYFLDIVVSHDGEASAKDMRKKETQYQDIETAVQSKVFNSAAKNSYKCIAQTTEGKIAKFADVIAYLATDLRDGFRLGIYKDFPEASIKLFGEMFASGFIGTEEEKIKIARTIIDRIKEEKLRDLVQDAKEPENKETVKIANEITAEITGKQINFEIDNEATSAIIRKHLAEYRKSKEKDGMTDEERAFLDSDVQKIKEFVGKKLRVRSTVVAEVTSSMQEFFINDLLKYSKETGILQFSPLGNRLFFEAKGINYDTYVPKVKWEYQKNAQPKAAYSLVTMCAQSLLKSGVIANKFYDRSIRKYITDEEALKYFRAPYRKPQEYEEYKRRQEIRDVKTSTKRYTSASKRSKVKAQKELFSNVYEYVQNEGKLFAIKYMNTFGAVETQIRNKVEKALEPKHQTDISTIPPTAEQLFRSKIDTDIEHIRSSIQASQGTLSITPEQKELVIQQLVDQERQKMEEKMAVQLSIDYLAGMTDRAFNELAIQTGYMVKEDLQTERVDGNPALQRNKKVEELSKAMRESVDEGR